MGVPSDSSAIRALNQLAYLGRLAPTVRLALSTACNSSERHVTSKINWPRMQRGRTCALLGRQRPPFDRVEQIAVVVWHFAEDILPALFKEPQDRSRRDTLDTIRFADRPWPVLLELLDFLGAQEPSVLVIKVWRDFDIGVPSNAYDIVRLSLQIGCVLALDLKGLTN